MAKLVEPGYAPTRRFSRKTQGSIEDMIGQAYALALRRRANQSLVTRQGDMAEAVWPAANDRSGRLRFPASADAVALSGAG